MSDDRTREIYAEGVALRLKREEMLYRQPLDALLERCESPIERMLAIALVNMEMPFFFGIALSQRPDPWLPLNDYTEERLRAWVSMNDTDEGAVLYPQQPVLDYRVDFLLVVKLSASEDLVRVVIECDGHNFHERTKEQAARDRQRDRAMTAAGYRVFRFTGSEIYRDPFKCASEVQDFLWKHEYSTRDADGR